MNKLTLFGLAGASHRRATINSFGWRILLPRHNQFVWPAHPIAAPQSIRLAGASHRLAADSYFCRRILLPCSLFLFWPFHIPAGVAAPSYLSRPAHCRADLSILAGSSTIYIRRAAINSFGRRIPSLRRNIFFRRAHPIAAPPSILSAGASHCCAAIFSFGGRISLLRRHLFFRPAHPIIAPQYFLLAGASHRCATIYSFGWRIHLLHHIAYLGWH